MSRNEPSAHELARLVDRAAGDFPPHEPQGRARLSQARRAADAKWKRRARDRRALPLLGSGTQCACLLGEFPPQVEGELWAALGFQGRSHLVGTLVRCPRFKEDWVEGSRAPQMPRARPLKISRNLKFDVQCSLGSNPVKSLKIGCDRVGDVHDRSVSSEVRESGPVSRIKSW